MALCDRAIDAATRIIERAHRAGTLRPDFTGEDLALAIGTSALLARAAAGAAPDAWRRGISSCSTACAPKRPTGFPPLTH